LTNFVYYRYPPPSYANIATKEAPNPKPIISIGILSIYDKALTL